MVTPARPTKWGAAPKHASLVSTSGTRLSQQFVLESRMAKTPLVVVVVVVALVVVVGTPLQMYSSEGWTMWSCGAAPGDSM